MQRTNKFSSYLSCPYHIYYYYYYYYYKNNQHLTKRT